MANRFKSKRSESVVTQRPPEISGSKNALGGGISRGRNTGLVTGAGPESVKQTQTKNKFKSTGGGSLHYVLPHNKNQSALAFQSQASAGSGYDSQVSMNAQDAINKGLVISPDQTMLVNGTP